MSRRLPVWEPPHQFDEYRLLSPLGAGGMGNVYLAQDLLLDRTVAIKFIAAYEPDEEARARFLIEGRAAARLTHPNVVAVYRVGEIEKRPYIVTEYVRGQTLSTLDLPITPRKALEMGIQLARGLASAHRQGVVHRDIKPGNIILTEDGVVKLLDFGLAKFLTVPTQALDITTRPIVFRPVIAPEPSALDVTAPIAVEGWLPQQPISRDTQVSSRPVTRLGTVMGTPHYMAPEVWRNLPATPHADVYALGAVLYELCSGAQPHNQQGELSLQELGRTVQNVDARPLASVVQGISAGFAEVIDRCLQRAADDRYASAEELREALEQLALGATQRPAVDIDPYPGLASFEAEHRAVFFGRGREIRAIVERLRATGLVLVAGDSGIGKSSICRAGVLPLISDGELGDHRIWRTIIVPVGQHPVASLAAVLAPIVSIAADKLAGLLRNDFGTVVRELRAAVRDKSGVLLFFDQLEELVSLSTSDEANTIAEILRQFSQGMPGLRAIATVRGDSLTKVAALPGMAEEAARALYLLGPLAAVAIKQAVESPALARGVRFESADLVNELVDATAANAGGLPLLQFALAELWQARDLERNLITRSALTTIGGVTGALARHADSVVAGLMPTFRPAARRLLMSLVTPEGTRARVHEEELVAKDPNATQALAALVRGRLVLARDAVGDEDAGSMYELAHEALLTGWDTLRRWLSEKAGSRVILRRLELAAKEWERLGQSGDALWGRRHLAEVDGIDPHELEPRSREFLVASRRRATQLRWLRLGFLGAAPLFIAIAWGGVQLVNQQKRASEKAAIARELRVKVDARLDEARELANQARRGDVAANQLRASAFAAFTNRQPVSGEEFWAKSRAASLETDRAWRQAEHALEQANHLDPTRHDVKQKFADVLAARAEAAYRDRRIADQDDLTTRLATYDEDGSRLAALTALAKLRIALTPSHSLVGLERYVRNEHHVKLEKVGPLPSEGEIEVSGGSYLITVAAEGRVTTRFPVMLAPGEGATVSFELPRSNQIPPDYVYVPPGRFLRGSADDEGLRSNFFRAPPLHQAETAGFVIARHETTYEEWIAFLEALPQPERLRRTPRVQVSVGFRGGLSLEKSETGAWRLSIATNDRSKVVKRGEALRYDGRTSGALQNWLRLPVAGVSFEDTKAYVGWLHASGRLPGARLCSELEWERAARGADGRAYPYGEAIAPTDANFDATYGKIPQAFGPDEVGSHPAGASPFGLEDMAGNVWELTRSADVDGEVVAKGGSYYSDALSIHAANRELPEATFRDSTVGFRVCADLR